MFQKFSPQHGWSSKPTCCNLSVRFAKSMIMLFMMVMVMVVQPVPGCITPLQCIWRISLSTSRYQRSSHGLLSILIPIISIDPFTNNLQQISIICISQTYVYNTYIHAMQRKQLDHIDVNIVRNIEHTSLGGSCIFIANRYLRI